MAVRPGVDTPLPALASAMPGRGGACSLVLSAVDNDTVQQRIFGREAPRPLGERPSRLLPQPERAAEARR